jgi:epoxyqueuosine reductase QueG
LASLNATHITPPELSKLFDPYQLKHRLLKAGATLVGFADVSEGLAKELRHLPAAITIAVKHPKLSLSTSPNSKVGDVYLSNYPQIDRRLEMLQSLTKEALRQHGLKYLIIPADSNRSDKRFITRIIHLFPHKTGATCAGLGWIGKNGLLINKDYGAMVSWATVLTDAVLPVEKPTVESKCGNCRKCVDACPANAVNGYNWYRGSQHQLVDFDKCRDYLLHVYQTAGEMACGKCVLACDNRKEDDRK